MEAVDFTVKQDDGQEPRDKHQWTGSLPQVAGEDAAIPRETLERATRFLKRVALPGDDAV